MVRTLNNTDLHNLIESFPVLNILFFLNRSKPSLIPFTSLDKTGSVCMPSFNLIENLVYKACSIYLHLRLIIKCLKIVSVGISSAAVNVGIHRFLIHRFFRPPSARVTCGSAFSEKTGGDLQHLTSPRTLFIGALHRPRILGSPPPRHRHTRSAPCSYG